MKKATFFILLLSTSVFCHAQSDFAKENAPLIARGFDLTIEVAEAMPENLYLYKPEKGAKPFAQQIIHATYVFDVIIDGTVMGNQRKFNEPDASRMSKEDVISLVKKYKKLVLDHLNKITESQLAEQVKLFGRVDTSKKECIYFARDHMTNHRAKANLYVRVAGIKPPAYGYF